MQSNNQSGDIRTALSGNFKGAWVMLRQAIKKIPDERWQNGICEHDPVDTESKSWFFSLTTYHAIETTDFYSRNTPDGMNWGERAGILWRDVKDIKKDVLPKITKKLTLEYLDEMEERVNSILSNSTPESFLEKDGFHWFSSILSKLIYLLRHTTYHAGELGRMLREWECELLHWE